MSEFTLNTKQTAALNLALKGESMWIVGPPGTGKTFLNEFIRQKMNENGKVIRMTALTGTAASLMTEGLTIHSFTGTGSESMKMHLTSFPCSAESVSQPVRETIALSDVIVIDEASMMGETARHHLHLFLQEITGNDTFNGGIQVILVGDIAQLPPICATSGPGHKRSIKIPQKSVFLCPDRSRWKICVLSEFVRQAEDPVLQNVNLASIDKDSEMRKKAMRVLKKHCTERGDFSTEKKIVEFAFNIGAQILTPTNARVEELIKAEESILKKKGCRPQDISPPLRLHDPCMLTQWQEKFLGGMSGLSKEEKFLLDRHSFENENLRFYPSQITRITRNGEDQNGIRFMNGDLCRFINFDSDKELITVKRMKDSADILLPRVKHTTEWFKQIGNIGYDAFPLVRSVAMNIHKSQGQTLSKIVVDPTGLHHWGGAEIVQMINVMFSRVRRLSDIYLTEPIREHQVDDKDIDKELRKIWSLSYMAEYPKADVRVLNAALL
jgi:hypothetical protein